MYEILADEEMITIPDGTPIPRKHLPSLYELVVDGNTTYDDYAEQMQIKDFAVLATQLAQIQGQFMNDQNKYEILSKVLEKTGINTDAFLSDPSQNVDPQAAHEAAEYKALQSENQKVMHQITIGQLNKLAADTALVMAKTQNELKGSTDITAQELQRKAQKDIMDAQNKAEANAVKNKEVDMKQDLGNKEFVLAASQHAHDITSAKVNGVR